MANSAPLPCPPGAPSPTSLAPCPRLRARHNRILTPRTGDCTSTQDTGQKVGPPVLGEGEPAWPTPQGIGKKMNRASTQSPRHGHSAPVTLGTVLSENWAPLVYTANRGCCGVGNQWGRGEPKASVTHPHTTRTAAKASHTSSRPARNVCHCRPLLHPKHSCPRPAAHLGLRDLRTPTRERDPAEGWPGQTCAM